MKSIILIVNDYINSRDVLKEIVFRGTGWELTNSKNDYPVLNIIDKDKIIASYKSWHSIRFEDTIISEKEII